MSWSRSATATARRPAGRGVALLTPIATRFREQIRTPLYGNVWALTLNTAATTLLGMAYWVLAARLYTPEQVGRGGAMVSTMTFLSALAQLNLNGALARFLPSAGGRGGRLVRYAYGASVSVALLLGAGFLVFAPLVSAHTQLPAGSRLIEVAFVVAVAAWTVFALQDTVLTALRGAFWVPVENAAFGIAKIVLLVLLAAVIPGSGVFLSWNVPVLLTLIPVNLLVFGRLLPRLYRRSQPAALPGASFLLKFVTVDYVAYLFYQTTTNGLPVLVTAVLGAAGNAVFYVGWLLGSSLELVTTHFGTSVTVESAADPSQLADNLRRVLRRGMLLFALAALLMMACAPVLLRAFGTQYASASTAVVRLFAIAVVPKFVVAMFVASCRVRRRVRLILLTQASTAALVVPLAVLLMRPFGVTGVGIAYLTAQAVMALAVSPALVRLIRGGAT